MGTGTGEEVETQKSRVRMMTNKMTLNSSSHENGASTNRKTGSLDRIGVVGTKNNTIDGSQQSSEFVTMTNSEVQPVNKKNSGQRNPSAEPEPDYEETSRQRSKTRVLTITKLSGTDMVTPPLVTPLVDNGASVEEALTNIVDSIGEQNEQMSLRMKEL